VIGLDTNVLVRYVMQDDPEQAALAGRCIESLTAESPGFVPLVAVIEFVWVLSSAYGRGRDDVSRALEDLLRTRELIVERAELVWQALRVYRRTNCDFADTLLERSAAAAECTSTLTFDRGAARDAGMALLA